MLKTQVLPMIALRGLVVFPYTVLHFDLGREISINAMDRAMLVDQEIFLCAQKDIDIDEPSENDIYRIGTVARIKQVLKLPGDSARILVEGLYRAVIVAYTKQSSYFEVEVNVFENHEKLIDGDLLKEAYMRRISDMFLEFAALNSNISSETVELISGIAEPGKFADTVASYVVVRMEDKQQILECIDELERLKKLAELFARELELLRIDKKIDSCVKAEISKNQKEYFLKEQIKVIKRELGSDEEDDTEILKEKLDALPLTEEAREKTLKEIKRLSMMAPGSPENIVSRTYIDWMLDLPWGKYTSDNLDLINARKILDEDHYGLEKLKDRIIEFLAVRKLRDDMKGPILCFVGPPGVGKTSITKSIARALEKNFVRMSLGGVHDEAEIRGHRKTYIGSVPGRIITSIKQAGSMNPLFLLDEIDKMASDFHGDPASAMLEVLDPEINSTFADHYLDIGFDLSKVMFITTANDPDSIPGPLYDRMEIIDFSSYTECEKLQIAKRHLIPKQEKEHGLECGSVRIADSAVLDIINRYTAEAGVRSLEREIATIMRKCAVEKVNTGKNSMSVTKGSLKKYLGLPKRSDTVIPSDNTQGVAIGLAWTIVGGQTLPVEVSVMPGTGKLELTGQLGDVMKESARIALSVVRNMSSIYGIPEDINEKKDIHIHCPEGAVPKDGPSAGVTLVTSLVSALTGIKVRCDVAMTGEVTLTGRVLKIGGLKEKSLAALRAGIRDIIIPADNESDISEFPQVLKKEVTFHYVKDVKQVLKIALEKK